MPFLQKQSVRENQKQLRREKYSLFCISIFSMCSILSPILPYVKSFSRATLRLTGTANADIRIFISILHLCKYSEVRDRRWGQQTGVPKRLQGQRGGAG